MTAPMTDYEWSVADRLTRALERQGRIQGGLTASAAARVAGCGTEEARLMLDRLTERGMVRAEGNGRRTRWHHVSAPAKPEPKPEGKRCGNCTLTFTVLVDDELCVRCDSLLWPSTRATQPTLTTTPSMIGAAA